MRFWLRPNIRAQSPRQSQNLRAYAPQTQRGHRVPDIPAAAADETFRRRRNIPAQPLRSLPNPGAYASRCSALAPSDQTCQLHPQTRHSDTDQTIQHNLGSCEQTQKPVQPDLQIGHHEMGFTTAARKLYKLLWVGWISCQLLRISAHVYGALCFFIESFECVVDCSRFLKDLLCFLWIPMICVVFCFFQFVKSLRFLLISGDKALCLRPNIPAQPWRPSPNLRTYASRCPDRASWKGFHESVTKACFCSFRWEPSKFYDLFLIHADVEAFLHISMIGVDFKKCLSPDLVNFWRLLSHLVAAAMDSNSKSTWISSDLYPGVQIAY